MWLHYLSQHYNPYGYGYVPARRSIAEAEDYWTAWGAESEDKFQDAIQGAMEHAWAVRVDATTAALERAIFEIHTGKPVQRALNEAQAAVTPR
jgi:ABC-type glycerol-3-phosphate transport system substrate-binding protein